MQIVNGKIKYSETEKLWADDLVAEICDRLDIDPGSGIIAARVSLDDQGNPKWGVVYIDTSKWSNPNLTTERMWSIAEEAKENYARRKELPDGEIGFPPDLISILDA